MPEASSILSTISPLPFVLPSGVHDGWEEKASSCCRNCNSRACTNIDVPEGSHGVCEEGMSFNPVIFLGHRVCIGGYINESRNNIVGSERRKSLKRLWTTDERLQLIIENVKNAEAAMTRELEGAASETTFFLHDVRTGLSLVMSSCERLISARKGSNFAEKLRDADPELFRLYQAIGLLTEQLGLVDILSNPQSITYGPKSKSDIYQFFHKMVKLFQPRAWDRNMDIRWEGNVYDHVDLYNSFQLVPLVLLDNAVKYGTAGSTIFVRYEHRQDGLYVEFSSWGLPIPPGYEEAVFKKNVRGPNAIEKSSEGSGLGLYIASEVARAHKFQISYESRDASGDCAWNCFTLFIDAEFLKI